MGCVSSVDIASPLKHHQSDLPHERVSLNNMAPAATHEGHTIVPLTSTLPGTCRFVGVVEISGKQEAISCPEGSVKLDAASGSYYLDLPILSQSWVLQVYIGEDPCKCDTVPVNVVARRQSTVYHLANAEVSVVDLDTLRIVEDVSWVLTAADRSQLSVSGSLAWRNAIAAGPTQ